MVDAVAVEARKVIGDSFFRDVPIASRINNKQLIPSRRIFIKSSWFQACDSPAKILPAGTYGTGRSCIRLSAEDCRTTETIYDISHNRHAGRRD